MSDEEIPVFTFDDEATMLAAVREVISGTFGIELAALEDDELGDDELEDDELGDDEFEDDGTAMVVETDLGTLIVALHGDSIISMELGLPDTVVETAAVLDYLNSRNATTTFVIFSIQDERVWITGFVDGHPFAPGHLVRVLDFMFQAASVAAADLEAVAPA